MAARARGQAGECLGIGSRLGAILTSAFDIGDGEAGGWSILHEPQLHLGTDVMVPAVAGWRRERVRDVPEDQRFVMPPDWVCEILSPPTAPFNLRKLPLYAAHTVPYACVIYADARIFQAFTLKRAHWLLAGIYGGEDKIRAVPFDAIEIDLTSIWGPDSPAAP
jgi:Uma2 family endonuclease